MKFVEILAWILLIVGGLNWGLVGAFDFNLVTTLFGSNPVIERVIYIAVGLSALYGIFKCRGGSSSCCK
jgi:uncharacterized membrane protein YuzA (DUF378 family)